MAPPPFTAPTRCRVVVNIILKSDRRRLRGGRPVRLVHRPGPLRRAFRRRRWRQRRQEQPHPLRRVVQAGPDLQLRAPLFGGHLRHGHLPCSTRHWLRPLLPELQPQCAGGHARRLARRDPWWPTARIRVGPNTSAQQFVLFNLSRYVTQQLADDRRGFTLAFDHKISDDPGGLRRLHLQRDEKPIEALGAANGSDRRRQTPPFASPMISLARHEAEEA